MSKIDPEVLYLILTKVAAKESFYNYDPAQLPSGQTAGTITHRHLGEVYERITGNRTHAKMNWNASVDQLNALIVKCGLPSLAPVVGTGAEAPTEALKKAHSAKWPPFSALKKLYRK